MLGCCWFAVAVVALFECVLVILIADVNLELLLIGMFAVALRLNRFPFACALCLLRVETSLR